jgi:hypothetical protein
MATATARFSSTTGEGAMHQRGVQRSDARPVRLSRAGRPRVAGGDGRLQGIGAAQAAEPLGSLQRREAATDEERVPARAILVQQQHGLSRGAGPRAQPRGLDLHERDQAVDLGLLGREPGQDAPQAQRLVAQRGPHPVVARRGRIALVEDEVDDLEHRGQPRGELGPRGISKGTPASARVRFALTMRWATVASLTRKARASSAVVRPPSRRSVSATRASVDSSG